MKKNLVRIICLIALCLTLAAMAPAQDTVTGAFEGTVTNNQTGEPIAAAEVAIVNQSTGLAFTRRSNTQGRFFQGLLAPGTYLIRVAAPGFQTREVVQALKISFTGEVVPVPVTLEPAAPGAAATPTPPGTTPTPALSLPANELRAGIGGTDGAQRGSFSEKEAASLPLGGATGTRTFDELALLLPGVAPPPQTAGSVAGPGVGSGVGTSGQFAVNGLRSRANNFTVDGSDNNDEDIGVRRQGFVALVPQPIESIQEYQVISLLPPAQFGRNLGGQINAVSKSGGNEIHGNLYGFFNSSQLNARNFFDTTNGRATTPLIAANGRAVRFRAQSVNVTNQSGGEDSLTFGQGGFTLGGPFRRSDTTKRASVFFFSSLERAQQNATQEGNFAVPTVEQRGFQNSGASGLANDPLTGRPLPNCSAATQSGCGFPSTMGGDAVFSLFPFANNPGGVFGANTFTQTLPDSARGTTFSGKVDANFTIGGRPQSFTGRYNFTDDQRDIPQTGGAIFSSLRPRIRAQNFSSFYNSQLSEQVNNQIRASYGRTRLVFDELRDTQFLTPSPLAARAPAGQGQFLLNNLIRVNNTLPNSTIVNYGTFFNLGVEDTLGAVGQVSIAGFSPVGVDVFNFPQRRVNNTYQLADALTARTGNHRFGFGADLRRSDLNSDLPRNSRRLITFYGGPQRVGNTLSGFASPLDLVAASAPTGVQQAVAPAGTGSGINLRYFQYNFYGQDEWRATPKLTLSFGLRYEYNTPPREQNRLIENTFNSPALSFVPGLRTFLAGRTQIFDPDKNNFAPRVGLAYAPDWFGKNHYTALRLGYGWFYDQALGAVVSQSRNVFPNFLTLNLAGDKRFDKAGFQIGNPAQPFFQCGQNFTSLIQANTINTLNPAVTLPCLRDLSAGFAGGFGFTLPARQLDSPNAQHYTATFEQQLSQDAVLTVSYVGTQGRQLLRSTTPNLGSNAILVPTTTNIVNNEPNVDGLTLAPGQRLNAAGAIIGGRPVAQAGSVLLYETSANSRYDSLQVGLRGRLHQALNYQISYVFSRAIDDVSDVFDLAGASSLPQNSLTRAGERGRANFDTPQRLTYTFGYDFSTLGRSVILKDLQLTGTGRWQTGQPFTVNSIFDVNLDGNLTDRLDNLTGLTVTGNRRQPLQLQGNGNALLAAVGQDGRIGRNTFRAGDVLQLDLSALKNITLAGRQRLQLRADLFNFINRANFGAPVRFLGGVGFGQAVETVTPGRRLQVALKYQF